MGYTLRVKRDSGVSAWHGLTLLHAHVELGRIAERDGLSVDVHEGEWTPSAASVAYRKNGDPLLDASATVRID